MAVEVPDEADADQHQDDGHGPAPLGDREAIAVADGGHGDDGPPEGVVVGVDVRAGGVLLEEQDQPGAQEQEPGGGQQDPEQAAVAQNGEEALDPFAPEHGRPLDAEDPPDLEEREHDQHRLDLAAGEVAATVGHHDVADETLEHDHEPDDEEGDHEGLARWRPSSAW